METTEQTNSGNEYHLLSGEAKHRKETCMTESSPQCSEMTQTNITKYLRQTYNTPLYAFWGVKKGVDDE